MRCLSIGVRNLLVSKIRKYDKLHIYKIVLRRKKREFMYRFESRVRFSETDKERKLTLEAIVDYFQDCSTFQTEDLGVGFSYLLPKNLTWVLSYWQIVVEEYPALGEEISICTIPYDFRGFFGKRNFFIEKCGKRIAKADTLWTLLNMEKMIPEKISEEISSAYPKEDKIEMEYLPRKITINGIEEAKDSILKWLLYICRKIL